MPEIIFRQFRYTSLKSRPTKGLGRALRENSIILISPVIVLDNECVLLKRVAPASGEIPFTLTRGASDIGFIQLSRPAHY